LTTETAATAEITVPEDATKPDRTKGAPVNRPAPAPIRFRRATEADRSAIEALQQAAYSRERLLGLEPPPLKADYADIMTRMEVWLAEERAIVRGVLVLDVQTDDLVIWSIAAAPDAQGQGLGQIMLDAAEVRAEQLGRRIIRLDTGAVQQTLIGWYSRHGYTIESRDTTGDHPVTHMIKRLAVAGGQEGQR
jgi:ribosomal protein S18 acetylase RimI-like enzyme